ncbi:hypothetical protein PHYC_03536 [Phycisphaerales bacterium]|nr:hypothetical protein PHYC_03536 [Phycisphaerales bacterium]
MAKQSRNRAPDKRIDSAQTSHAARFAFSLGLVFAAVGIAFSALLAFSHLRSIDLPGCGAGSACARAAAGPLGTLPGLGWPTSFLGVVYFLSSLAGLAASRGRPNLFLATLVRAGAVGSIFLLGGMAGGGYLCWYCVGVHVASLGFWASIERARRAPLEPGRWQSQALASTAILAVFTLTIADIGLSKQAESRAESRLAESTSEIIKSVQQPAPSQPATTPAAPRFEGRYRLGPELARIRLVMFTDYQCEDCQKIERELAGLLNEGLDLSVSIKQFPLNSDCNPNAPGQLHANACWASRASEAAGLLLGADGFWKMHHWLFARGGSFTDGELDQGLAELGFPRDPFIAHMTGPEVNKRITADIEEGMNLGIFFTPMIFINGVELKGWNADKALTRAVHAALAAAPATAAADRPPEAPERFVADWRSNPVVNIPEPALRHTLGPDDAEVRVVIIGDYQESFTSEADGLMRLFTSGPRPNVRYSFVQFPVNQSCNPVAEMTLHPMACRAALAAEAAGVLDGPEGFWRMHGWLMSNRNGLTDAGILDGAESVGFDRSVFAEAMEQPFLSEYLTADTSLAKNLGIRSIPMVFVNGKHVARWKYQAENVLGRIFNEAAEQSHPPR